MRDLHNPSVYFERMPMSFIPVSAAGAWIYGFWEYYWVYARTQVGIHAVATAALTVFGLLMYFHEEFVVLAIGAYLFPPMYLYLTGDEPENARAQVTDRDVDTDTDERDTDTDSDGTDTDTDTDGSDTDSDTDGVDADSDGADADADADADAIDADADADG